MRAREALPATTTRHPSPSDKSSEKSNKRKINSAHRKDTTFLIDYTNRGDIPSVKRQIIDLALNGSGIRDTARVLNISPVRSLVN